MKTRQSTLTALALGLIMLAGCAVEASPQLSSQPAASQLSTSKNAGPTSAGTDRPVAVAPAAAAMVCSSEAKENVTKILELASAPLATPSWDGSTYSCVYKLPDGPFTMTVEVASGDDAATAEARILAASLNARPIVGLSNLGLPGYQSGDGDVVFAKDNMTLHVDATTMKTTVGAKHVPRADFAYQMATTILACWTEH